MNTENLVKLIKTSPEEEAVSHLNKYINDLAERLVENAWRRSRTLLRFSRKNKKEQLRKHLLEMNDETGAIELVEFVRFFAGTQEEITDMLKRAKYYETREMLAELEDIMYAKIGNIKIDRRTIFGG